MASDSDSDEFFDAEDSTPVRKSGSEKNAGDSPVDSVKPNDGEDQPDGSMQSTSETNTAVSAGIEEAMKEVALKAQETEKRQRQIEEMRRRMLYDDDEPSGFSSEDASIASSSTDGLSIRDRIRNTLSGHHVPMTVQGDDSQSTVSLGSSNVGSILSQKSLPPEPDLVASTKGERGSEASLPVAPPRKRKRNKNSLCPSGDDSDRASVHSMTPTGLPSPQSAVDSIAQELEFSLDLSSAIKGQYVVKPQDDERDRGPRRSGSKQSVHNGGGDARQSPEKPGANSATRASPRQTPEGSLRQLNMVMRTRSDSGRPLTDMEILEQIEVLNLDTGEKVPLSIAEDKLPQCLNPLSLHIMRLTSEYVSNSDKSRESDEESIDMKQPSNDQPDKGSLKQKATRITKMIGKKVGKKVGKTVSKLKTVADEKLHSRHCEEVECSDDESSPTVKVKTSSSHKSPPEFGGIRVVQEITGEHTGAVWTMKFSACGRLMATAGQDNVLRIWVLRDAYKYFDDMRQKYNTDAKASSQENLTMPSMEEEENDDLKEPDDVKGPFMPKPFCHYRGHTADLLDVSWSKNYFILSSSMDKTVRLWHISRRECLCCFQHVDFVTAIAFHPRDDRYFLSGSLDGKLRLWNIPDKKVALWNELDGQTKLITSANFCQNGKFAVVGSYDGRCIFYNTEQLKYYTQIHVRSTRGKNKQGRKISGIEPMPGEDKILVTSNDSRVRLYDLRDLSLSCKYKGYVNLSSQIKATFSHDGRYVISGSENQFIYIWKTYHDYSKFSSARRDRNYYWEGVKAHNAVVTSAVFAPRPDIILKQLEEVEHSVDDPTIPASTAPDVGGPASCYVIISADFSGTIKVFVNRPRAKATLPLVPAS
ncbi:WD repeat-containing protein 44-like [Ornithodoros turicata]|uniref:WD repeat-containing protein 44-like n=1 Tax=Ornithodoros turicata TaxID=34597 RepID=UPI0031395FF9